MVGTSHYKCAPAALWEKQNIDSMPKCEVGNYGSTVLAILVARKGRYFDTHHIISLWNWWPQGVVMATSLDCLKKRFVYLLLSKMIFVK